MLPCQIGQNEQFKSWSANSSFLLCYVSICPYVFWLWRLITHNPIPKKGVFIKFGKLVNFTMVKIKYSVQILEIHKNRITIISLTYYLLLKYWPASWIDSVEIKKKSQQLNIFTKNINWDSRHGTRSHFLITCVLKLWELTSVHPVIAL